ncbi:MAG: transcription-repair coupling factor, partial [Acidimicrobiales bacterium]|nr:transcription-repair coupling factor [Acidimicrobiales bacterium]
MSLRSLPSLLRDEPALVEVVGRSNAVLAVPEPARAFVVAGLAQLSGRTPLLVALPTRGEADAMARDLAAYLGPSRVAEFPAWETLPFERVSPSVEAMGHRLEVMRGLRQGDEAATGPTVVVAPVRALVQRLADRAWDTEPLAVARGDVVDLEQLVARLVTAGYRREYQVEHRGEVSVRGGIVDVFPSTAESPVRIDLWGDEVDRLTEFDVSDQRSVRDLERTVIFACRELVPTEAVRRRASELVGEEPWGRAQWEKLSQGLIFDGMESLLPWLSDEEHLLPDLLGPGAQVVLVEPRRMRDRAAELSEEEASLATTLAQTWGADLGERFPSLYLPFDRLLAGTRAPVWSVTSAPEGPDGGGLTARGWDLAGGDAAGVAGRLRALVADRYRVVVCADGRGSAARMAATLSEEGLSVPVVDEAS